MTVNITKPAINLRSELADLRKPTGIAGEAMLRADTPQEQFNLIGAGRRNMVINGAMRVAQRATSSTVSSAGYFVCDRWLFGRGSGTWNLSQGTSGPTGFSNTLKMQVSTTGGQVNNTLQYRIEGQDLQSLSYGNAQAKEVTFSFWVKSNVTGTYTFELYNNNSIRQFGKNYTIDSSGVWEYKTITFSGDPTNGFANNNASSLLGIWWLSAVPSYMSGTQNTSSWKPNVDGNRVNPAQPNLVGTVGNYFEITGVQMEIGKVATPFEHRSYGEELALCQRYFQIYGGAVTEHFAGGVMATNRLNLIKHFPVTMRAAPSFSATLYGGAWSDWKVYWGSTSANATGTNENYSSISSISIGVNHGGSSTIGGAGYIYANNTNARLSFDAEL